ncbi:MULTISPECIES: hypothetical protein [unclassified Sphingopyxis]|uniref:hypothetical protein n=1 Tax=unclassified Sphingopyxis TaxID=2614943 RepID=UPI00073689F6|nr:MULTISPECIES: hypothetical protein [unclassified Sphingopyxis]KTE52540.1 hypothetical protein ATE69_13990 [Sphingopyxis sp. H071]
MTPEEHIFAVHRGVEPPELFQRVVRVLSEDSGWSRIKFGDQSLSVPSDELHRVANVAFEMGALVNCDRGSAIVRDVIWHFKDQAPAYYLMIAGKKISKRYLNSNLKPHTS